MREWPLGVGSKGAISNSRGLIPAKGKHIIVTLSAKTSLMLEEHKAGFRKEGHILCSGLPDCSHCNLFEHNFDGFYNSNLTF